MTHSELEVVKVTRQGDDPILYVDRRCEFTRIIVSLRLNQNAWLTSLGWQSEEKSIALNCDNTPQGLAIRIPKKHAKTIMPEDVIYVSCQELEFRGRVTWGGTAPITKDETPQDVPPVALAGQPQEIGKTTEDTVKKPALPKTLILSSVAAIALIAIIGTIFIGGDKEPNETSQKIVEANIEKVADKPEDKISDTELDSKTLAEKKREAAQAVADEIEAKKNEADFLAKKKIQDEKDAIAAKKQAKLDEAKKKEDEKAAAAKAKKEKAEKAKKEKAEKAEKEKAEKLAAREAKEAKKRAPEKTVSKIQSILKPQAPLTAAEITQMQEDLAYMGYHSGAKDGVLSANTLSSITLFKSIFEITDSTPIDRSFLKTIKEQRDAYVKPEAAPIVSTATIDAPIKALQAPAPIRINRIPPTPSPEKVVPPAIQSETPTAAVPAVKNIEPEPITQQAAINTPSTINSAPENPVERNSSITPPKLIKKSAPKYPDRPNQRIKFIEDVVKVSISFGVDVDGKPTNIKVIENDHGGSFKKDFNRAAIKVARSQKFEPAKSGNQPVAVEDLKITISFKK